MALRWPWGVLSKVWCSTGRPASSITQAARVSLWESIPAAAAGAPAVVAMGYRFCCRYLVVGPRRCATMRRENPYHVGFELLLSDIHKGTRQGGNHQLKPPKNFAPACWSKSGAGGVEPSLPGPTTRQLNTHGGGGGPGGGRGGPGISRSSRQTGNETPGSMVRTRLRDDGSFAVVKKMRLGAVSMHPAASESVRRTPRRLPPRPDPYLQPGEGVLQTPSPPEPLRSRNRIVVSPRPTSLPPRSRSPKYADRGRAAH